jgi:hypothetical protein
VTQAVWKAPSPRPQFDAADRQPWRPARPAEDGGEIVEVQFLLPRPVLDELIDAADEEGITAAPCCGGSSSTT